MIADKKADSERIESLQKEIANLKSQWPAHSVPAAMLQRLDELEEALEKAVQDDTDDDKGHG